MTSDLHNIRLSRPLLLASASPRRAALLRQVGLPFTVVSANIPEHPPKVGEAVDAWAIAMATAKARAITPMSPKALVLGVDTVVVASSDVPETPTLHNVPVAVLGKPSDAADASRMLTLLSGRDHIVLTAYALVVHPEGEVITGIEETRVTFRELSDQEIADYVATGEPLDKAGAYGIQGLGATLIRSIAGDYYTVVGLPLARLWESLLPWREVVR